MTQPPLYRERQLGSRARVSRSAAVDVVWTPAGLRFYSSDPSLFTRRNRIYLASLERSLAASHGLTSVTIELNVRDR